MGMYTELVIKADVKQDISPNVREILEYMFNDGRMPDTLPEHHFFNCPRWTFIGKCSSYYHIPWATSQYKEGYIFSRSDLKNYDNEISDFIDWVTPYLDQCSGDCIGWSWYEEAKKPTLIMI